MTDDARYLRYVNTNEVPHICYQNYQNNPTIPQNYT